MHPAKSTATIFCTILLLCKSSLAMPVSVFTDALHPVVNRNCCQDVELKYYCIGSKKKVLSEMLKMANSNYKMRDDEATKRFVREHEADIKQAIMGDWLIKQYNVTKIPSIVFDDGKYIVEGQTDLNIANNEYLAWKAQQ